jgi:hypothetical protein
VLKNAQMHSIILNGLFQYLIMMKETSNVDT